MARSVTSRAWLGVCLAACACGPRAAPGSVAEASGDASCEPRPAASTEEAAGWGSLLNRGVLEPGEIDDLEVEYAGIPSPEGCITAAALAWGDDRDGGLVLALPGGEVVPHGPFPDARAPVAAGPGRVGFRYTAPRGAGALESRFHMLCSRSPLPWVDCLDVVTDQTIYPDWNPLPTPDWLRLRTEHRASVRIQGDSVVIEDRALHRKFNGREPTSVALEPLVLRLPSLPR